VARLPITVNHRQKWNKRKEKKTYQLHNELAKNLFANSLCKALFHPSPLVALPPFQTLPLPFCISAAKPVTEALTVLEMGWGGKLDSDMPSWSFGIRLYADACPEG
jgi:hypothetical protein